MVLYMSKCVMVWSFGLITSMIILEVNIFVFLSAFSEPTVQFLGGPIIPIELDETERVGRIIMLYHAMAIPFIAAIVFFVLDIFDVRDQMKSRVKSPLLIGSILSSVSAITFANGCGMDILCN